MIDGIIKADGTSRLMRATLPATYEEFKAQAATGTLPLDVLFNADGWSQMPTFLNKATLLKDVTASLFGKGPDAVPDHVFEWLGQYNQHWWSVLHGQASFRYDETRTASSFVSGTLIHATYNESTFKYADSISIDQKTGAVSLVSPTTVVVPSRCTNKALLQNFGAAVQGKYASGLYLGPDSIYFVPSGTAFAYTIESGAYYGMQLNGAATLYKMGSKIVNIPAGETTYAHSTDRNAYPDSGTVDGLTYQYLGIPFQNAVTAPKIATGSYVGTGTYGADNPNSLTFDFAPKAVFLIGYTASKIFNVYLGRYSYTPDSPQYAMYPELLPTSSSQGGGHYFSLKNYAGAGWKSGDGKTIYWWNENSAEVQVNISGRVYHYLAIG